jgi:hypothetical protein
MKKLLLLTSCLLFISLTQAQTVVGDTVHYYFNKYYFKTGDTLQQFKEYYSPAATGTAISHVGCIFDNSEPLEITGINAFLRRHPKTATSSLLPIKVGLYLCNVGVNNLPLLPPIDSVRIDLFGSTPTNVAVGGQLTQTNVVTGRYAILFRNLSTKQGDTIMIRRTSGMTFTSTADPKLKCSDSYGVLRFNTQFYSATNYPAPGFGYGTDFEFCLAPIVQYTVSASQIKFADTNPDDTIICTHQQVKFVNTSTARISSRFYNLIEFRYYWDKNPPFASNAIPKHPLPADKRAIAWHFLPEDDKNFYLPDNSNTLIFQTDSAWKTDWDPDVDSITCFPGNQFRVNLYGMNARGGVQKFNHDEEFVVCTRFCNGDNVGVSEHNALSHIAVYPNPTNGSVTIDRLVGRVNIELYSMTGQLIRRSNAEQESVNVDISGLAPGTYMLRVGNDQGSRSIRVLKN